MKRQDYKFIMPSTDHIRMKLVLKEPEWVNIAYAPKMINSNWRVEDLEDFIIKKGIATQSQLNHGINVENKFRKRPAYELRDYDWYILDLSVPFIKYLKELHQFEEAELFYHEQYLDYQLEDDNTAMD